MTKFKIGRPTSMRDLNKKIVLDVIRKEKSISKIELSRITGLKPPTVSNIINELLNEGLIIYFCKGDVNRNGGPKPDLYKLNDTSRYFIGIDVCEKGINGVILDLEENIVQKAYIKFNYETQEKLTEKLIALINSLLGKSNLEINSIEAIVVALTALVDANSGIVITSDIKVLQNYKVKEILKDKFPVKVYVDNDIDILAVGHKLKDSEMKNILCIGIRSGIGLGIIIDRKIYRGNDGMSGNIGHYHVNEELPCRCGKIGCLETVIGEAALENKVRDFARSNRDFELERLNVKEYEEITIEKIYYALRNNDQTILEIVEDSFFQLAVLVGKLIQIFNPAYILLGGEIFNHNERLFKYIVEASKEFYWDISFNETNFVQICFDNTTIAYSAAKYAVNEFFNVSDVFSQN